jgi:hypothetical protein
MSEAKISVGKGLRIPLGDATAEQIRQFLAFTARRSGRGRFARRDRRIVEAAKLMLEHLENEGLQVQHQVEKPTADVNAINLRLERARREGILVSRVPNIWSVPDLFGVAFTVVRVNVASAAVYPVGDDGKVGLSKEVLKLISEAAGVQWNPETTRRRDPGTTLYYCEFGAEGALTALDGSRVSHPQSVLLDYRDDSIWYRNLRARVSDDLLFETQLAKARYFIHRTAETQAMNRVIAAVCGIQRAYEPAELEKSFVIPKLVMTGQSKDPELEREVSRMRAQAAVTGGFALFGAPPTARVAGAPAEVAP